MPVRLRSGSYQLERKRNMEQMYYHMTIAGCDRALTLCPLNE